MTPGSNRPVTMLTSSYPRFPGDGIGSFLEPIAHGVAAGGRDVDVVAPWHPELCRPAHEGRVRFHFYRYAPTAGLHVFGYAAALKADVSLRPSAYLAAPPAVVMGCRALRRVVHATKPEVVHAHWVVPSGVMATLSLTGLPLVISLHGSDIFLAEQNPLVRVAARIAFRKAGAVTACSNDLRHRAIALGAREDTTTVVPYGVDTRRFRPDPAARTRMRRTLALADGDPLIVTAGRLVRKKGFEYLIDGLAGLTSSRNSVALVVIGDGDLRGELEQRAATGRVAERVHFLGAIPQDDVAAWLAAADVVVVPSVRDASGNVDGLPNVLLEALSTGTPVVTTSAGGIESVAIDGETARLVPEKDGDAIASTIDEILRQPTVAAKLGHAARERMCRSHSWATAAHRFEDAYRRAVTGQSR